MENNEDEERKRLKYELLFKELHHQDTQLWQLNVFFFALNVGLFTLFGAGVIQEMLKGLGLTLARLLISVVGITSNILWFFGSLRINAYINARNGQIKSFEEVQEYKILNIYQEAKFQIENGSISVKKIYYYLIPLLGTIGWGIVLGIILSGAQ